MSSNDKRAIIALDVGERRIGVAWADGQLRIPLPLITLEHTEDVVQKIVAIYHDQFAGKLVVGLPRNQQGEETKQSEYARNFAEKLKEKGLPVIFQDESLTSVMAEEELKRRKKPYAKEEVDSLAATFILQDYLQETGGNE